MTHFAMIKVIKLWYSLFDTSGKFRKLFLKDLLKKKNLAALAMDKPCP